MTFEERIATAREIICGIDYLHSHLPSFLDLNLHNVLTVSTSLSPRHLSSSLLLPLFRLMIYGADTWRAYSPIRLWATVLEFSSAQSLLSVSLCASRTQDTTAAEADQYSLCEYLFFCFYPMDSTHTTR